MEPYPRCCHPGTYLVLVYNSITIWSTTCLVSNDALFYEPAAIQRDPNAQKALDDAARITAKVKKVSKDGNGKRTNKGSPSTERAKRDAATDAVKASIQVSGSPIS